MKSKYFWTKKEEDVVKKYGAKLTATEIHKKLPGKSAIAITHKRKLFNITPPGVAIKWTKKELEIVKKYGHELTAKELHKKLPNKSINLISRKRKKLKIKPSDKYYNRPTP